MEGGEGGGSPIPPISPETVGLHDDRDRRRMTMVVIEGIEKDESR